MKYIVVQAGGKGTRLGQLTKNKPKALVPVENLPMLFHLFHKYPDKCFVIIADYKKEVLHDYLWAFAKVKYLVVEAEGNGTCAGVRAAVDFIPEGESFMLVWSDLILPEDFILPEEYRGDGKAENDYIGISKTFPCRWSYKNKEFFEERSLEKGVAGFFLFSNKEKIADVPKDGELVRWMQQKKMAFKEISLAGTREFGVLSEYEKLEKEKCRPFNRVKIEGNIFIKEAIDEKGRELAKRECAWYEKAVKNRVTILPKIYENNPLKMEYIKGKNVYESILSYGEKKEMLRKLVSALKEIHNSEHVPADSFSLKEAYYNKTMDRIAKVEDLVPFARDRYIDINGRRCRNIFYHKHELEKKLERMKCERFCFIHGDCTFSNLMLRENGEPVLIDPRGYFGYTELYGDVRYDWAKLYYSIIGNYDRFNLKDFRLNISDKDVNLEVASNHWEDMEEELFVLTGADRDEIRLLHAIIWLSLTTYAWQDFDSVCGAFYNGLYYLEEVL